jgi:hypothetical protein
MGDSLIAEIQEAMIESRNEDCQLFAAHGPCLTTHWVKDNLKVLPLRGKFMNGRAILRSN